LLENSNDFELNVENWTNLDLTSTNVIDLEGWCITGFGLSITTTTNGIWGYAVSGWGVPIPEPSCSAMVIGMGVPFGRYGLRTRLRHDRKRTEVALKKTSVDC
jgi:hypothetical protein